MFVKVADCQSIAWMECGDDYSPRIIKTAANIQIPSFYANPGRVGKLDIGAALERVAETYDVSKDPNHYIYEAVRAVTTGIPNENGDAFHRDELLRFDHRLGCAVYQTFILKPHLVNHRANNPKTARGVILDAHYNDDSAPLEVCPACNSKTAANEGRDATGLYCRKCGKCVKDEFTEILIAIDTRKDPTFAEGVRTGVLNATSMGCICESTTCNVCNHVAYTKDEFCVHIRGGNKKRWFKTASGEKQAFEWCNNVIFTEDSRVDQPADPKALQREVLRATQQRDAEMNKAANLRDETLVLKLSKQIADLNAKVAQLMPPAAVQPGHPGTIKEYHDKVKGIGEPPQAKGLDEMGIETNESGDIDSASQLNSTPQIQESIHDSITASVCSDLDEALFDDNRTADRIESKRTEPMPQSVYAFRDAYKNIQAQVTEQGNVRVANHLGTLFVVEAPEPLLTDEARTEFGSEVLRHIAQYGLTRTINAFDARQSPKIANILEKGIYDFDGGRNKGDTGPITKKHEETMKDKRGEPKKKVIEDGEVDRASKPPPHDTEDSIQNKHEEDHTEGRGEKKKTTQTPNKAPQKSKTEPKKLSDSVLDGNVTDHTIKLTGAHGQAKEAASSTSKPSSSKPSSSKPASTSKPAAISKPASKPSSGGPSSKAGSKPGLSSTEKGHKLPPDTSKTKESKAAASPDDVGGPPPGPGAPPAGGGTGAPIGGGALDSLGQALTATDMLLKKLLSGGSAQGPEIMDMLTEAGQKLSEVSQKLYQAMGSGGEPGAGVDSSAAPGIDTGTADLIGAVQNADTLSGEPGGAPPPPPAPGMDEGMPIAAQLEVSPVAPALKDVIAALDSINQVLDSVGDPSLERPVTVNAAQSTSKPAGSRSKASEPKSTVSKSPKAKDTSKKPFASKSRIHWSKGERPWDKRSKAAAMSKTCTSKCPADCKEHTKTAAADHQEARQYESRLERLYKRRLAQVKEERDQKVAQVADVVAERFRRAMKLAASRQRLNLEESPIKIAFADVLLNPMDLPGDEYFPGMDVPLAQTLIERAAADGFDPFVDQLITRAAEFMKISDESFMTLEADVKNLQPVLPVSPDNSSGLSNHELRHAAANGNMHLASRSSEEAPRMERMDRSMLRTALSNTKIHRSHAPMNGAG